MGFDLEISVPALTVFIQGILSFFSPCVLPLVPLYAVSYTHLDVYKRQAMDHLKNELGRFSPREAVLSDGAWSLEGLPQFLRERLAIPHLHPYSQGICILLFRLVSKP